MAVFAIDVPLCTSFLKELCWIFMTPKQLIQFKTHPHPKFIQNKAIAKH